MPKKKKLIPFHWLPGSWGLTGALFDEYEARYYLTGEDLERRLVDIRWKDDAKSLAAKHLELDLKFAKIDQYAYDMKLLDVMGVADQKSKLDVDMKHGKVSEYERDKILAEIATEADSIEREKALLEVQFKHQKITKFAYEKHMATIEAKPWIAVVDQGFDLEKGVNGVYFEFDWNSFWIDYLHLNGYTGVNEDAIVQQWFQDVCLSVAEETTDADDEMAGMLIPVQTRAQLRRQERLNNRRQSKDGGVFYS